MSSLCRKTGNLLGGWQEITNWVGRTAKGGKRMRYQDNNNSNSYVTCPAGGFDFDAEEAEESAESIDAGLARMAGRSSVVCPEGDAVFGV